MYYVGNLLDIDNDGWVNKEQALTIINLLNTSWK